MEKKVMQTYLYDFYGDLLTERQRKIYEEFVLDDLSLTEIAQEELVARASMISLSDATSSWKDMKKSCNFCHVSLRIKKRF